MRRWLGAAGLVAVALVIAAAAQETRYEFQSIEVDHAATFQADAANTTRDWTTMLGPGPINVTFGAVKLHRSDGEVLDEGFLKLEGPNGTWRALVNGGHWELADNATHPTKIALLFWSAKQVEDNVIVKDFTPPIHVVKLVQHLEQGEVVGIDLWTDEGEEAQEGLWWQSPSGKQWVGRMETFRQVGEPEGP